MRSLEFFRERKREVGSLATYTNSKLSMEFYSVSLEEDAFHTEENGTEEADLRASTKAKA